MTDKLDVEEHSGPCDKFGICALCTLRLELKAKDETIAREHELYLTAHRDNMKAAAMIAELKSRAAALEKERDESRAMYVKGVSEAQKQIAALRVQLAQKDEALRSLGHAANDLIDSLAGTAAERRLADLLNRVSEALDKAKAALRQSVPASHEGECGSCGAYVMPEDEPAAS